jgi:uncharacterized Zn finger protein
MISWDALLVRHCPACGRFDYVGEGAALEGGHFACPNCGEVHGEQVELPINSELRLICERVTGIEPA